MIDIPDWVSDANVWTQYSNSGRFDPTWYLDLADATAGMFETKWGVAWCLRAALTRQVAGWLPAQLQGPAMAIARADEAHAFRRVGMREVWIQRVRYSVASVASPELSRTVGLPSAAAALTEGGTARTIAIGGVYGTTGLLGCRPVTRLVALFFPPRDRVVSQDVLRLAAGWLDKWWTHGVDDHLTRQIAADALQESGFADEERLRFLQEAPNCFPGVWPFVPAPAGDHKRSRPPRKETADAD